MAATGILWYDARSKPLSSTGTFMAGCYLNFYLSQTTTATNIYMDGNLSAPHSQPLISGADGRFPPIYLDPNVVYRYQLYSPQNVLLEDIDPYIPLPLPTALQIGQAVFPQSAAEVAVNVIPANFAFPVGDIRRYGAALDGASDDTTAVQAWASVGGSLTFPVAQTTLVSSFISFPSNTTVTCAKGATIRTNGIDFSVVALNNVSNVTINGLKVQQTVLGGGTNVGLIALVNCTACRIVDCEAVGYQFQGIRLSACTLCIVEDCYVHGGLGNTNSTADIAVESSQTAPSTYNIVRNNRCYGGGEFGIACWDPYSGTLPLKNIIEGNRIGGSPGPSGYGILIYMPDTGDSFNQVIGNEIENVTGAVTGNPSSGAGIYVVGSGAGGTVIANNVIRNCCINTANASLAPAGIGINGTVTGAVPLVISGNVVEGMTQYWGIYLTGVLSGASVVGNTIRMPAANSTGNGIEVANCFGVTVSGNTVNCLNVSTMIGICVRANGAACTNVTVADNIVMGGVTSFRTIQAGGNSTTGLIVEGNHMSGAGSDAFRLDNTSCQNVLVQGNNIRATVGAAINHISCTSVRYANNFVTANTNIILFTGTNTSGFYERSNFGQGAGAGVQNQGTGMLVETAASAVPSAGTWGLGDLIWNVNNSAAGVSYWVTTTAGTGGGTAVFKTVSNT